MHPTSPMPQLFTGAPRPVPPAPRAVPAPAAPVALPTATPTAPTEHVEPTSPGAPMPMPTGVQPFNGTLDTMLVWLAENNGSDLHLAGGEVPRARINGDLIPMDYGPILTEHLETMLGAIMSARHAAQFKATNDVDLAYQLGEKLRFRVNVMRERGRIAAVMRTIPTAVKTVEELGLPTALCNLATLKRGLVLVCGPTGSGKSTTLAAMINLANRTRRGHIITIEDPVEFPHASLQSKVTQREVGADTESFASGLRAAMRQDPDIILVGELRDQETTRIALEAAETGHLVFATMHTKSALETVDRFAGQFPDALQNQVRMQLAQILEGVIVQQLVKTVDGNGRAAAREILLLDTASRALIRSDKLAQITSVLQGGVSRGMTTMDMDLARLVNAGVITREAAAEAALFPDELATRLSAAARRS
ncbi:PilT/PilU family type 4a pilus ATPase [Cellulosimicrobium sp. Marseille-Q4280]|uniref:type IV pilus twitching motility protein PilT n=1 Tax=Cellulosimicrobium sp. Marseille-Q4280 TaxID=2937992 RepID=UPI0020403DBC|nr:PilT/PilU family type 4a pilus ATPase [Cellulosimicrobium sp. Marseille-Q4280]